MIRSLMLLSAALGSASPAPASPLSVERPTSSAEICGLLEAAYSSAIGSERLVHPVHLRAAAARPLDLKRFVPDYKAKMALKPGAFEDLVAQQAALPDAPFQPDCAWTGPAGDMREGGRSMTIAFSPPVFATDRRLALVEVSFFGQGEWGYGKLCIAERGEARWSVRCLGSWIS